MVGKRLVTGALSAALTLGSVPLPAIAEEVVDTSTPALEQSAAEDQQSTEASTESFSESQSEDSSQFTDVQIDEPQKTIASIDDNASQDVEEAEASDEGASEDAAEKAQAESATNATQEALAADVANDDEVDQSAPAFDIDEQLLKTGAVSYTLLRADGSTYQNSSAIRSAGRVASVGDPYRDEQGRWAVDVVLSSGVSASDFAPAWALGGSGWSLDEEASKLTLTFRTLSAEGTAWYCTGADRASLVFEEQVDQGGAPGVDDNTPGEDTDGSGTETPDEGAGTETPDEGTDTETPDEGTGTDQGAQDNGQNGNADGDENEDSQTFVSSDSDDDESASTPDSQETDEQASASLPQTSDPGLIGAALATLASGIAATTAGLRLHRRRKDN